MQRSAREKELDEELKFHLECEIEANLSRGMNAVEARQAALASFGSEVTVREDCRASWGIRMVDDLIADIRYGWRQILKHKNQSFVVIFTLALCLGANTTAFSFVKSILLRPFIYENPDSIVKVGKRWPKFHDTVSTLSVPQYLFIEDNAKSFSSIGFIQDGFAYDLTGRSGLRRVKGDMITPGIWQVTGVKPLKGRVFDEEDIALTGGKVVVISHELWTSLAGAGDQIVGAHLELDSESYQVTGVMPPGFYVGFQKSDVWLPKVFEPWEKSADRLGNHAYQALARLQEGTAVEQADLEMKVLHQSFLQLYPQQKGEAERTATTFGAVGVVEGLSELVPMIGTALFTIQGVTILVLLIGCMNVAGVLLIRYLARVNEFAMRRALGATKTRLIRQVITEIMLIYLLGGLISFIFLEAGLAFAREMNFERIPWGQNWELDYQIFLVTLALSLVAALFTAAIPLQSLLKKNLMTMVKEKTRGGSHGKRRFQAFFVVGQITLALVLLSGAGLFFLNFRALLHKNIGFERQGRVALTIPHPEYRFGNGKEAYERNIQPFRDEVLQLLGQMPGVVNVAVGNRIPLSPRNHYSSSLSFTGYELESGEALPSALCQYLSPGYFKTVASPILLGRDFSKTDTPESRKVALISKSLADQYLSDQNPLDARISLWGETLDVIGVVGEVRDQPFFMQEKAHNLYLPLSQWNAINGYSVFIVHVSGDEEIYAQRLSQTLLQYDPLLTVEAETFNSVFEDATFAQEIPMLISAFFGVLAMFMAGLGLYGLINFIVMERTREFGIRLALGASRKTILQMVLNQGLLLLVEGLFLGGLFSLLISKRLSLLLTEIDTLNLNLFLIVMFFVAAIAMLASSIPAFRATRINISDTLRYD